MASALRDRRGNADEVVEQHVKDSPERGERLSDPGSGLEFWVKPARTSPRTRDRRPQRDDLIPRNAAESGIKVFAALSLGHIARGRASHNEGAGSVSRRLAKATLLVSAIFDENALKLAPIAGRSEIERSSVRIVGVTSRIVVGLWW